MIVTADAAALAALRQKPYESPVVLPLTRLFDMGNPMQRALFDAGLTVAVLGILRHVIYQLTLFAANGRMDAPLQIAVDLVGDPAGQPLCPAGQSRLNCPVRSSSAVPALPPG